MDQDEVRDNQEEKEEIKDIAEEENVVGLEEGDAAGLEEDTEEELTPQEVRRKASFIESFESVMIDELILAGVSFVLLYVVDYILKYFGYQVAQKGNMVFIIFVVVTLLYVSIMESTKSGNTFGKKVNKLKVYREQ